MLIEHCGIIEGAESGNRSGNIALLAVASMTAAANASFSKHLDNWQITSL